APPAVERGGGRRRDAPHREETTHGRQRREWSPALWGGDGRRVASARARARPGPWGIGAPRRPRPHGRRGSSSTQASGAALRGRDVSVTVPRAEGARARLLA